jgi:type I restriction enzyme R subunit
MNLYAGRGVAVREYPLTWGSADYVLFVDRQAVSVIEAKKEGVPQILSRILLRDRLCDSRSHEGPLLSCR